jgi:hypothetical protein
MSGAPGVRVYVGIHTTEENQVEQIVNANARGLRGEQPAAERDDPIPGKQQVSADHAHHRESEPKGRLQPQL